ncbi:hypothetical protein SanaruYs_11170 [Chryseotalea sanaruensis]|uniref:Uncharacterized protein n=1 Tax=Chryseotalea sanaruensis TaxID=2482724 RepID=A0A401U7N1_9BACT|nr:hypothetical protein [Chryseotalea sanaruensis]GCC50898.1 hypothetical protein SanaruYs_11170 [Chryseotalea sanaruensis]
MIRLSLSTVGKSILCFLILEGHVCNSQNLKPKSEPKHISKQISLMYENDQKYRGFLAFGVTSKEKLDSLNKLPRKLIYKYTLGLDRNLIEKDTALQKLSLKQTKIDSCNAIYLKNLIIEFGWPLEEKLSSKLTTVLYHMNDSWIREMYPILLIEVKSDKMNPLTLANLYDKFLLRNNQPELYHTLLLLGKDGKIAKSLPKDIEATNKARIEIGLKPLKLK